MATERRLRATGYTMERQVESAGLSVTVELADAGAAAGPRAAVLAVHVGGDVDAEALARGVVDAINMAGGVRA